MAGVYAQNSPPLCCPGLHVSTYVGFPPVCPGPFPGTYRCLQGRCGDGICEPGEGDSITWGGTVIFGSACGCTNDCFPDGGSTGVVVDAGPDGG
jgi:hypothetical protein